MKEQLSKGVALHDEVAEIAAHARRLRCVKTALDELNDPQMQDVLTPEMRERVLELTEDYEELSHQNTGESVPPKETVEKEDTILKIETNGSPVRKKIVAKAGLAKLATRGEEASKKRLDRTADMLSGK